MTINSIANTVDAHIADSEDIYALDDVSLIARESDTLVVLAGGFAVATSGTAVGAAVAYNYIGGSFDIANPDVVNRDIDRHRPDHRLHRQREGDGRRRRDRLGRLRRADDPGADDRRRLRPERRPAARGATPAS